MDENKDFPAQNFEPDDSTNSDADTVKEQSTETAADNAENNSPEPWESVFSDELDDIADGEAEPLDDGAADVVPAKKKRLIQIPIIVSIVIVAVAAIVLLVVKCFFNTSIVGTWIPNDAEATADEASDSEDDGIYGPYYVFNDDNTAVVYVGTIKYQGEYAIETGDDGVNTVTMNIPAISLQASFEYDVSGNVFTGRKLVFTSSGSSITFDSATLSTPELKVDDDFEPNDKLSGKWIYTEYYYDFSYEFRDDGTVTVNQLDQLIVEGVYTYTDDKITIKYYLTEEDTMELDYSLDGNTLNINGLPYVLEGTSSADES